MHTSLLEAAGHLSADLGPHSCHRQSLASPQVTTDPSARIAANASASCLKLLDTLQLILDFRAVTTRVWFAPCDNSVTSRAKQGKSSCCCCHLCLQDNSRQMVSVLKSCSLQRHCRIQRVVVCSHKPQEATLQGFLCQNPQVPYFGGLRNRKLLTATAWQSYSNLKHIPTNSNVRPDQFLQLSQTASLFEQWNKLPRPTRQSKPFTRAMIGNCLSKGHDEQSL